MDTFNNQGFWGLTRWRVGLSVLIDFPVQLLATFSSHELSPARAAWLLGQVTSRGISLCPCWARQVGAAPVLLPLPPVPHSVTGHGHCCQLVGNQEVRSSEVATAWWTQHPAAWPWHSSHWHTLRLDLGMPGEKHQQQWLEVAHANPGTAPCCLALGMGIGKALGVCRADQ